MNIPRIEDGNNFGVSIQVLLLFTCGKIFLCMGYPIYLWKIIMMWGGRRDSYGFLVILMVTGGGTGRSSSGRRGGRHVPRRPDQILCTAGTSLWQTRQIPSSGKKQNISPSLHHITVSSKRLILRILPEEIKDPSFKTII